MAGLVYEQSARQRLTQPAVCSKTVFASRSQLCVHGAIKQMTGHAQRAACEAAVQSKGCTYKVMGTQTERTRQLANIADIEDLVHVGMAKHVRPSLGFVCPHFCKRWLWRFSQTF